MDKIVAALGIIVGGLGVIFELMSSFGVDITQNQQTAIAAAAALGLTILGVWFHPAIPIGSKAKK